MRTLLKGAALLNIDQLIPYSEMEKRGLQPLLYLQFQICKCVRELAFLYASCLSSMIVSGIIRCEV